jgi:hypothetical protein
MLQAKSTSLSIACMVAALLTSCGSHDGAKDSVQPTDGSNTSAESGANISNTSPASSSASSADNEPEGPQYQMPTMLNLKGVPQQFPARYAVKKYPKSQVVLVQVQQNLYGGEKNQVMLRSSDPPTTIASYYEKDLSVDGWKLVYKYENSIYSSTKWQKNGQELEVRVSPDVYNHENIQLITGKVAPMRKIATPVPAS